MQQKPGENPVNQVHFNHVRSFAHTSLQIHNKSRGESSQVPGESCQSSSLQPCAFITRVIIGHQIYKTDMTIRSCIQTYKEGNSETKKVTCRNHYVRNITCTHYLLNMSSLSKSSGVGLFRNCITRHLSANWLKALSSWQLAHMESSFLSLRMTQVASTYGLSCFSWGLWWRCQD